MKVKLHTKVKHQILGYYYAVLSNFWNPMYTYYYVDLFSGDGMCIASQIPEELLRFLKENEVLREWPPPYFELVNHAKQRMKQKKPFKFRCIFNDTDSNAVKQLADKTSGFKELILDIGNEDANTYYKKALQSIKNPKIPSLFYLDPQKHDQLKFQTIVEISKFKAANGRMPELIINLMAFTMLKALQRKEFKSITESLGTAEWLESKDVYRSENMTHELFRITFCKELEKLGYKTTSYYINSIEKQCIQYYLVFATYDDRVHSLHKAIHSKVVQLQEETWVKKIALVKSIMDRVSPAQKQLFEFNALQE